LDTIRENEPLLRYTSWKIGGPARFFADVTSPEALLATFAWANEHEVPLFLLGGGSNLLVRDSGFSGLVVRYRAQQVVVQPHGEVASVTIDAGAPTAGTVRKLTRQGWSGLEWAEGVPGTIGGALFGNAGCYGGAIAESLRRAWVLRDGSVEEWSVERFAYGYRTSALKQARRQQLANDPGARFVPPVVLSAEFQLQRGELADLGAKLDQIATLRRSKSPTGQSCGSVFKNPPGDSAGRLIESVGLKGASVGGASIAEKHANYILNRGDASSDDVLRLVEIARERVFTATGITLELEIELVG
jgi:UDP-N-acetylmuramate dehydrogenase